jgi:hypothetical protein
MGHIFYAVNFFIFYYYFFKIFKTVTARVFVFSGQMLSWHSHNSSHPHNDIHLMFCGLFFTVTCLIMNYGSL